MQYFKNIDLSRKYGVSPTTVQNWINASKQQKNNLQLTVVSGRDYILDSKHNQSVIENLLSKNLKFKNRQAYIKLQVDESLYKIFSESQLIELITSLEYSHKISLKFTYFDKGADIWDKYVMKMINSDEYYFDASKALLDKNLGYILFKLKDYEVINIVDLGVGNGYSIKDILSSLSVQAEVRYTAMDISPRMLEILNKNIDKWHKNLPKKSIVLDIENAMIRDVLFNNKLEDKKSCNLILLIGSTIGNLRNRLGVLNNIRASMSKDDFLLLDNGLDIPEWRTNFVTINDDTYKDIKTWIPKLLGLDESCYELVSKYDEETGERIQNMKLTRDITLEFKIKSKTKLVNLTQGQKITIWNHYSHTLDGFIKELDDAKFAISHLSCYPDLSRVLSLCQVKS